jgi:hypothetical protein
MKVLQLAGESLLTSKTPRDRGHSGTPSAKSRLQLELHRPARVLSSALPLVAKPQ